MATIIGMGEATVKSLCVIYGWRTNYSNWNPLPPKLALSFRHLSPTEPAPTRMKPVAVPPKAWATMKLCVKPTNEWTVSACKVVSLAQSKLSWTKQVKLMVYMISMAGILHLAHLQKTLRSGAITGRALWSARRAYYGKFSTCHRALCNKTDKKRKRKEPKARSRVPPSHVPKRKERTLALAELSGGRRCD